MKHTAVSLMLQGTASGVGKSTLAAGICRILHRRGFRTAPFKAQNLSDNVHLLPDGRRMARSQAIAAAACGLSPVPDMNPVLLCPCPGGCEWIVNGSAVDHFDLEHCRQAARLAYERLSARFDAVVVEGAGSPVELNLRSRDIVNMDFATYANCPVILVADIRRGGVFAAVYGTLALLRPEERTLVKGIIINDFCGDPASFSEGKSLLETICKVPVLGIVPHLELHLEDEDSLPGKNTLTREKLTVLVPDGIPMETFQEQQLDALADQLESCLDMASILQIMEEGV